MRGRPVAIGLGLAAAVWSTRAARSRTVSPAEERCFRAFNDGPDSLLPFVWPVMQLGSLASVYARAESVRRRDSPRSSARVALVGTAVWAGVKLVKPLVGRGRPAAHLTDVHVRGQAQSGLGFPSGHAAVSFALATIGTTPRGLRSLDVAGALATAAARMYVGAHLPLDVVGGAGAGLAVGALSRA